MLDSIYPANLPPGADAYLCYTDGNWPTYAAVKARFGGSAHILPMAVFSSSPPVEGYDGEPGDILPAAMPGPVRRSLDAGIHRPVVYASASNVPAYLAALASAGISRSQIRLLSAHYGAGKHICGPATCAYPGVPACDGTQWRDTAPGTGSSLVDESLLLPDFFQEAPMAITDADAAKIAHAVWTLDGLIANPNGNPKNPFWTGADIAADTSQRVRAVQGSLAALVGQDDPAALAKAVLAGLDPAVIAAAVAAAVGPDVAQEVVAALAAQLGKP
jgi:hypothetical protein